MHSRQLTDSGSDVVFRLTFPEPAGPTTNTPKRDIIVLAGRKMGRLRRVGKVKFSVAAALRWVGIIGLSDLSPINRNQLALVKRGDAICTD